MRSGGVKLALWAQTDPFSEMSRPRLSVFHMLVICSPSHIAQWTVKLHLLKTVMLIQLWGLDVVMVRVLASSIKCYVFNIRLGLCKDCKICAYKLVLTFFLSYTQYFRIFTTKVMISMFPCELTIYMKQQSSSACIWSMHFSVDSIFESLWFLPVFPR